MGRNVAEIVRRLEPEDVHLLSGVEHGMRFSEWVDRSRLPSFAGLDAAEVDYRLERCLERELVERRTIQYEGVRLRMPGYDALALHAFAERGTIEAVGAPLGVGKESDVLEARSFSPMALKFHREGHGNFRRVDREREYTSDHRHVSPLYTARKAAEREYEVLEALYPDVSVPRPEDQNRHAIVMERLDGRDLSRIRLEDDQVAPVLGLVLRELALTYGRGYVHADLSEYNVFLDEDGVTLIDWPQAIPTDHVNADERLERDVRNVVRFFERKYPGSAPEVSVSELAAAVADGDVAAIEATV